MQTTSLVFATVTTPHGTTFGATFLNMKDYLNDKKAKKANGHGYTITLNKNTLYTDTQRASLNDLLSKAKQEGNTSKATPLNRITAVLEKVLVPSLFLVLLLSVVGLFCYMLYVDLIK